MEKYFFVNWDNYKSSFIHTLSTLRLQDDYTDVTLACEGKFYKVHKIVLSTCSSYFKDIFKVTPCQHPVIVLKDLKSEDLEYLLDYMYTGGTYIKQTQMMSLVKAAECLNIKGLAIPDTREDVPPPKRKRKKISTTPPLINLAESKSSSLTRPEPEVPLINSAEDNIKIENMQVLPVTLQAGGIAKNELPQVQQVQRQGNMESSMLNEIIEQQAVEPTILHTTGDIVHVGPTLLNLDNGQVGIGHSVLNEANVGASLMTEDNSYYEEKYNQVEHSFPITEMDLKSDESAQHVLYMGAASSSDTAPITEITYQNPLDGISVNPQPENQPNTSGLQPTSKPVKKTSSKGPIECPICHKDLQTNGKLTEHMRRHTGEKPFRCRHCDFKCAYKFNAIKHMIRIHSDSSGDIITEYDSPK